MFSLRRPSGEVITRLLAAQRGEPFTYAAVGATATTPPKGYNVDRTRARIGQGDIAFQRAIAALRAWRQFDLGWVTAVPTTTPIEQDRIVGVLARAGGLWTLNAARIVYVIDESARFGFAYGTLPRHVESGEERFLVELNAATGDVHYDILAFSRPRHPLARLAYPWARRLQRRFGRDSVESMQRAVAIR